MNIKLLALFLSPLVAATAFAQETPTPTATATATATATPVPTCASTDSYLSCVSACVTADPTCAAAGNVAAFVELLKAQASTCNFPGITKQDQFNGLKQIVDGLRRTHAISVSDVRSIKKAVDSCRKKFDKKHGHHGDNHKEDNHGHNK